MFKLKKIELVGFKSFCEKTVVTFNGNGVTCIVGPNGCGKSNIVDAMSWVLGEQSHKSLRAERMADCIFNGTQKRPPMGMAEVMLTLEDPELADAAQFVAAEEVKEVEDVAAGFSPAPEPDNVAAGFSPPSELQADSATPDNGQTHGSAPTVARRRRERRPLPHLRPGEVVVGRRLYRSGQSEYIINGRPARLRDVQELFMGTGLGPESYAIIEQGRIGQILSSKPMDRRAILEEAAGVSKFKAKKRLAEAKLEASKVNLARVNDIVVEIEKQLASLKRQAAKARRYAELREQMRGLMRQVLGSKARELDAEAQRLADLLHVAAQAELQEAGSLQAMEAEQERTHARVYELEQAIRVTHNQLGQTALELDRAENRIVFHRERQRELAARAQQLAAESEAAAQQARDLEAGLATHQLSTASHRDEHMQASAALETLAAQAANLAAALAAGEEQIAAARAQAAQLSTSMNQLERAQAQAEAALALHGDNRLRVERAEQQVKAAWAQVQEQIAAADSGWQQAESRATELEQAVANWQTRIMGLKHEQQATRQRCDRLRDDLSEIRARRASLEQILNEHSYTTDAVQKLFAARAEGGAESQGFRAVGVLADYAEVEERYEGAVEQFLRDELQYVVVETFDHARAGISLLRDEVGGRATFFVDSLRKLNVPVQQAPLPDFALPAAGSGVVARLDKIVQFRDPLGPAAANFLSRLQSAFLVESASAAEELSRQHPGFQFVTSEGTCYHGRLVSGGRPNEAGPLALKRELRAMETQSAAAEQEFAAAEHTLGRVVEELRHCEEQHSLSIAQHVEAQKARVAASHVREQAHADLARIERQLAEFGSEIIRLRAEAESASQRASASREQREQAVQRRELAEQTTRELTERLAAQRVESSELQERVAAQRAALATVAERLASAEQIEERLRAEWSEVSARAATLGEQRAAVERESAEIEAGIVANVEQREALALDAERLTAMKAEQEADFDAARTRTVALDDALRQTRQRLGDLREARSRHEVEQARNSSDRQHLRETCISELSRQPEDLIAELESGQTVVFTGEELAAAEANYRELKQKLENIGAVNMMALEEFEECQTRHAFLARERDDLVQSIADTQQTIRELDEISTKRFEEAFTVINRHFGACFQTLFGGGAAEMRLTEADSSGDRGIEVVAQPPGKRLQNVMLLSGGEKALTALALLIGIFRYQPSPFCILDEVDAPLDEANVGRFTKMIGEMCAGTQFLIVTHNKRTMEMAPVLYGVTMQEPGVSKLVSVRWQEAQPAATAA